MRAALVVLWTKDPYAHAVCNVEMQRDKDVVEGDLFVAAKKIVDGEKVWIPRDTDAMQAVFHMVRYELKMRNWREVSYDPHAQSRVVDAQMVGGSVPPRPRSAPNPRPRSTPKSDARSNSGPRSSRGRDVDTAEHEKMKRFMENINANRGRSESME